MVKELNSSEFQNEVLNSKETVLIDFFATWCGPCKMLSPVIEEIDSELSGKVKVYKVDVDKSGDLASNFSIMGVPTVMVFNGGKAVDKLVGFQPKETLLSTINKYTK